LALRVRTILSESLAQFKYLFMALLVLGKHKPLAKLMHQANRPTDVWDFKAHISKHGQGWRKKDELQIRLSS